MLCKKYITLLFIFMMIISSVFFKLTLAVDDAVSVVENQELIYYLKVTNDGNDNSSFLFVEDQIPEGLIFDRFITTDNGIIGAEENPDTCPDCLLVCTGYVVDDTNESSNDVGTWNQSNTEFTYHGLHYNAETRTVKFLVNDLQPQCQLTVGIVTKVPSLSDSEYNDVNRIDFYNSATLLDNLNLTFSNTLHHFLGIESIDLYNVNYSFTGDVPSDVPNLPATRAYSNNSNVSVLPNVIVKGYKFNGWSSSDVTIVNGSFKMPNHVVNFSGNFTEIAPHNVSYRIDGVSPNGYTVPGTKQYYEREIVKIDSLSYGDVYNNYRFLGWKYNNTDVRYYNSNDFESYDYPNFVMPNSDVEFVGSFEPVKYKITYRFLDDVLPENANELLPAPEYYSPGETVTLPSVSNVEGYKFISWNKKNSFVMPNSDIVVYGQWKEFGGYVSPDISLVKTNPVEYYNITDNVNYTLTINNTTSQPMLINGLQSFSDDTASLERDDSSDLVAPNINPGEEYSYEGSAIKPLVYRNVNNFGIKLLDVYFFYNYELEENKDIYTSSYKVKPSIEICQNIEGIDVNNIFLYRLVGNNGYDTSTYLHGNECSFVSVEPGNYTITQITPQEYNIESVIGDLNENGDTLNVELNSNHKVTFTNKFNKKGSLHLFGRIIDSILNYQDDDPDDDYFGL